MTQPTLSIIIPAYNEEHRLPGTLEQVFAFLQTQEYTYEVLVVENGSTDRTAEVAESFAEHVVGLRVVRELRRGKGLAIQRGMLEAHGEYRFMCDADLSMPIEQINQFIPPALSGVDVAIGSREAPGAMRYNEPLYRHLGGRVVNFVIRLLILPGLHDTQCGFKCFRAEAAESIFSVQTLSGWSFDIELLHIARWKGYQITDVPIHWYFKANSKLSAIVTAIRMVRDIFLIHINTLKGRYGTRG